MFKKNTAITGFGIGHFINASTGAAVTTGTPTCKRTLDGTGGACANAASYNTNGAVWEIDLAGTDIDADVVVLSFTLASCLPISYTIRTGTKLVGELKDFDRSTQEVTTNTASRVLSATAQNALVAAVEAALVDDGDATALLQAIADKFTSEFDIEEITLSAVATAVAAAILVTPANKLATGAGGVVVTDAASRTASKATIVDINADQSGVTIGTVTTNADMVGTDGANTTTPDAAGTAAGLHTTTDTLLSTIAGYLDTEIAAIKTVTDNIPDAGALTALLATLAAIVEDTDELQSNRGTLADIDGTNWEKVFAAILAAAVGEADPAGGVVPFKRQNGTTTAVTVTVDPATPGKRTASEIP